MSLKISAPVSFLIKLQIASAKIGLVSIVKLCKAFETFVRKWFLSDEWYFLAKDNPTRPNTDQATLKKPLLEPPLTSMTWYQI